MSEGRTRKSKTGQADAPRGGRTRTVAEMLPDIGRAAYRRFGFVQSAVVSRWSEIVGDRYAGVSTPKSIRFPQGQRADGVLTLAVVGAHAPMMQHVTPEIVERVNRFFGYPAVARVVIRQGGAPKPATPRKAPPSLKPLPIDLGDSLRAIDDPELKAVLESLARGVAATQGPPIFEGDA